MLLKFKSKVIGSATVPPAPGSEVVVNGDFTIKSNVPSNPVTGDGIDEITEWDFDFKKNPEWGNFSQEGTITSAKLTMTLRTNGHDLATDNLQIKFGALGFVDPTKIRSLPKRETRTIEIDLLREGYTAEQLKHVLTANNGVIPMMYFDDAFICFAELELEQQVSTCSCNLLQIQADSEDVIAEPGNRKPNYLVLSVSDADGNPVLNLTENNIQVDPMIVGPGGSLVEISRVQPSSRIQGFYFVDLKPIAGQTWKAGTYIFAVVVHMGGKRGQALARVLMDF